jgi:hypothetical protein
MFSHRGAGPLWRLYCRQLSHPGQQARNDADTRRFTPFPIEDH